jgi:hypothetical protein
MICEFNQTGLHQTEFSENRSQKNRTQRGDEMNQLHSIVYVSSAAWLLTEPELANMLADSRSDNRKNKITGALLYNDGTFFQYIEGPSVNLELIYEKIKRSHQHRGIIELLSENIDCRRFPDWYMGFFHPSKDELLQLSNRKWWSVASGIKEQRQSEGIQLLEIFCRNSDRLNAIYV